MTQIQAISQTQETNPAPPLPAPDWELYKALREQWTHEDNLVNHRLMWLILSEGLLFTAYGTLSTAKMHWLVFGFPFFGMMVAAVIGISIYAAIAATEYIQQQFDASSVSELCHIAPKSRRAKRGKWAAQALPFVFGGLWVLAWLGAFDIR